MRRAAGNDVSFVFSLQVEGTGLSQSPHELVVSA
jgi:hypothetical protein